MTFLTQYDKMSIMDKIFDSINEVKTMDLGEAAKTVEMEERIAAVRQVVAERALDIATDPETPQGQVRDAEKLYERMGVPLLGEQDSTVETESPLEQWVNESKQALAEQYECSPEDFKHITYERDGEMYDAVVYAGPNGVDLGDGNRSWDAVMADTDENKQRFTVRVGDTEYDTRQGVTGEAYAALVQAKKDAGEELPDSVANKLDNGWYTWTLLTGEQADDARAPIAGVGDDGSVYRRWRNRVSGDRLVRVRPAVAFGQQ